MYVGRRLRKMSKRELRNRVLIIMYAIFVMVQPIMVAQVYLRDGKDESEAEKITEVTEIVASVETEEIRKAQTGKVPESEPKPESESESKSESEHLIDLDKYAYELPKKGKYVVYLKVIPSDATSPKRKVLEEQYEVLLEKSSEEDFPIVLDDVISGSYQERSQWIINLIGLIVEREACGESLLGKILVAEEAFRNTSGIQGNNLEKMFRQMYLVKKGRDKQFHVYNGDREIKIASEDSLKAVETAMKGSHIGEKILKTITERKRELGLELDDECYCNGILFHYNPKTTAPGELKKRTPDRVPVKFAFERHCFYSQWLTKSQAISCD